MGTLTLLLLFGSLLSTVMSEPLDFSFIYRIHHDMFGGRHSSPESTEGSIEAHFRTNALGKFLAFHNMIYTEMSSGMPHFHCTPAGHNCTWEQTDHWTVKRVDMSNVIQDLTVGRTDTFCQAITVISSDGTTCSCPEGYVLNSDRKTCRGSGYKNHVLTGNSGIITSPNYPNRYYDNDYATWIVIVPPSHTITLVFQSFRTESTHDYLEVYDGLDRNTKLGRYSGDFYGSRTLHSTGNTMMLTFRTDRSQTFPGFKIEYNAVLVGEPVLSLSGDSGSLQSVPFVPESSKLCVYIIHKNESLEQIFVSANTGHDSLNLTTVITGEVDGWLTERFTGTLAPEDLGKPVTLSAHFFGTGSSVFSIRGCNAHFDEDVYIIRESTPLLPSLIPVTTPETVPVLPQMCYNGGIYATETKECACPAGFTGTDCQEGCGPNLYGRDCKGICSGFEEGCRKMIFCTSGLPCMCAPGFTGLQCNSTCPSGRYGASCRMPCGHCNDETCNIYTGECESGCKPGYYPPLCQDTYRKLSEAPSIEHQDSNSALILVRGSSLAAGRGTVRFYQVQYKEKCAREWLNHLPQEPIGGTIIAKLTKLKPGVRYQTRVIFIVEDGNSNQDIGVPVTEFTTSCTVPTSEEYNLKSDKITSSGFEVSWQYNKLNSTSCPVRGYEITFRDRWERFKYNLTEQKFDFVGLLPGRTYSVNVKAYTEFGSAPLSSVLHVTTRDKAPGRVNNLKVTPKGPGELLVSWNKPRFSGGTIQQYQVEYECLHLLACSHPCSYSKGNVVESAPFVLLTGLHPHAQYKIRVAGESAELGPFKQILAITKHTGADVAPDASPTPVTHLTNTSFTVHWSAPANCSWLNGYLYGYRYVLVKKSEHGEHVLSTGVTEDTNINFTELTPHSHYNVYIFVTTSGGPSMTHKLDIPVLTKATAPEQVQNMTIYKRGRRLIGVRWSAPRESYGPIGSFRVTYKPSDEDTIEEVRVSPVPCRAWPNMYCHTIEGLVPDTEYGVTVQARNTEVESDGAPVSVLAVTRETAPSAPTNLHIVSRTQTSMVIEWSLPFMINGVLRSFLVNVEEVDSNDPSTCCEYFPIQELPVRTEDQVYQLEVSGLRPASTLTISVSAKTVTMGPAVNLTASTPPNPPAVHPPELQPRASEDELFSVSIHPTETAAKQQSTYLLLILPPEDGADPVIWDADLLNQLQEAVNGSFYPVAEFKSESLVGEEEVSVGTGAPPRNGTFGVLQDPALVPGEYRAGVALVLDYCGSKSVGFAASGVFEVTKCIGAALCTPLPE